MSEARHSLLVMNMLGSLVRTGRLSAHFGAWQGYVKVSPRAQRSFQQEACNLDGVWARIENDHN